nr:hypothetical protein [Tanacetum cinerariifolium]
MELIREGFNNGEVGEIPATRVNLVASGVTCDGSPRVSNSSPLVSHSTIINVPRELMFAATFGVLLTTVGDLYKLIKDIEACKHDELLSEMTNDDPMKTIDALGTICNSIQADNNNAYVNPCRVSHVYDSINLNVDESTIPSNPIVQSVDINTKSTSYAGVVGASAKDPVFDGVNISNPHKSSFDWCLIEVNSKADLVDVVTIGIPSLSGDCFTKETVHVEYEWKPPRCDMRKIFGHVHDHCPKKVVSPPIVTTSNVVTLNVEKTNDGFQTVGKKKKRKGKSKSTNGGQTTGNSFKNDKLFMSNYFSALNDEEEDEDVENVYDESANLIQHTNASGRSSFTVVV